MARTHGLLSCAKHFPGLGAATIDPHEATAEADYDLNTWSTREMRPFEIAVRAQVDMIMTTHLRLPAIDDTIATGSSKITDHMIRTMLGYEGPVVTDDLLMSGAAELGDVGERAIAAFLAGHDLLLFGQDTEAAIEAMEAFERAAERGDIPAERIRRSLERIASVKCKLASKIVL
ncbi:hypothetical protein GF420_00175 [candidate division GN15 bacterium]|nr:hypothetical protein [candidate division GN15 bacterium]